MRQRREDRAATTECVSGTDATSNLSLGAALLKVLRRSGDQHLGKTMLRLADMAGQAAKLGHGRPEGEHDRHDPDSDQTSVTGTDARTQTEWRQAA